VVCEALRTIVSAIFAEGFTTTLAC